MQMKEVNFPPQRPSAKLEGNEKYLGHSKIPLKIMGFGRAMSKPKQLAEPAKEGDCCYPGRNAGDKGKTDHRNSNKFDDDWVFYLCSCHSMTGTQVTFVCRRIE